MARCFKCPWDADNGDQFCALCGAQLATCELEPRSAEHGILFYDGYPGAAGHTLHLRNRGTATTRVNLRSPHDFSLEAGGHRGRHIELQLEPSESLRLIVRTEARFPLDQAFLEIDSPVIKERVLRIPLIVSERPSFDLRHGHTRLTVTPPAELFPAESGECRWTIKLQPQGGAALVRRLEVLEGAGLKTTDLVEGVLLRRRQGKEIELSWDASPDRTIVARLQVVADGIPPQELHLRLHPRAAVSLRHKVRPEFGDALVVGARPQHLFVELWSEGFKRVRLREVRCSTPGVRLAGARVISKDAGDDGLFYPCEGALTPQAQVLLSAPRSDGPQPERWLKGLSFEVGPGALPAIHKDVISLDLILELGLSDAFGETTAARTATTKGKTTEASNSSETARTQTLRVDAEARALTVVHPDDGLICVDYGTVHTCVSYRMSGAECILALEGSQTEFKSAYLVESWHQRKLHFGQKVWDEIPSEFPRTDFGAKLRLGTDRRRSIRDRNGQLQRVDGIEAARVIIGEVLERTRERTGYDFKRLSISKPAAFDERATSELRRALSNLSFTETAIQMRYSEPEAYLMSLTADKMFLEALKTTAQAQKRDGRLLGLVIDMGGGTTDVSIFEYEEANWTVEIVASHGYAWLGGEMLTHQIAAHLFRSIPNREIFPFPEIPTDRPFDVDELDGVPEAVAKNFTGMRKAAEDLKCQLPLGRKKPQRVAVNLLDSSGVNHSPEIPFEAGDAKSGLAQIVWRSVGLAVDDTLGRCARMREHGALLGSMPQVVVLAGNGARLWCLQDIIKDRLQDAGAAKAKILFDGERAKTGVVLGLAAADGPGRLRITLRKGAEAWWYVRVGTEFVLARPAGTTFRADAPIPPHAGVPPFDGQPLLLSGAVELAQGPGPEERLDPTKARQLLISHFVDPTQYMDQWTELAFDFDAAGQPGLWLRTPGETWTWHAARLRGAH